ncbi:MAG TPA: methyltransferase domain-containing protein [Acidimicrobiales bacterium]
MPDTTSIAAPMSPAAHEGDAGVAAALAAVPAASFLAGRGVRLGVPGVDGDGGSSRPPAAAPAPVGVASLLAMVGARPGWRVLQVGAGTGYAAALLAHVVGARGAVTAVEADPDVAVAARRALVTARVPVRVDVRGVAAGHPEGAPFDAVVVTAAVDRVPRAWFDQLRPGGRLVAPLRLSPVGTRSQAVVALRKATNGFDHLAAMPADLAPLHTGAGAGRTRGRPARMVVSEAADPRRDRLLVGLAGPALAGLDRADRQRLAVTMLGFGRSRRLRLGRGAVDDLLAYVALALPEERLVEVSRGGGAGFAARRAPGVVDAVDGGLAVLVPGAVGGELRVDAWGGRRAERALLATAERWALAGRPGIGGARVAVRYGPVRPRAWWSARRGDQWLALDWG